MVRIRRYKDYTLKRYQKYKTCPFETYEPQKRVEIRKGHVIPFLFGVGTAFLNLGGVIGFGVYGFFNGLKRFLGFKKNVKRKIRGSGKVVEIRVYKRPGKSL